MTNRLSRLRAALAILAFLATSCALARAAEHVTLRNGFELDCAHRETIGDRVRLYFLPTATAQRDEDTSYMELPATAILRVETIPDPPPSPAKPALPAATSEPWTLSPGPSALTPAELNQLAARAGHSHNIDADLLTSLIHAESNGNVHAVSRAGAQGLMQLMPGTAADMGVHNTFAPEENVGGGTAYLDQLLTRYHDNIALALAAYNAGPAAVDRYHGIPPYAETGAYVARVIREFNRLKLAAAKTQLAAK